MIKCDVRKVYVFCKAGASGAWASEGDEFMGRKIRSISRNAPNLSRPVGDLSTGSQFSWNIFLDRHVKARLELDH